MMPNMMPKVGRGKAANVFYNTGHGHLGWTLSAVTADMVAEAVSLQFDQIIQTPKPQYKLGQLNPAK
jgi:D-amino-acid dehydrogenase